MLAKAGGSLEARYARLMEAPSLDEFRRRLAEAGWRELSADEGSAFGSWSIELEWSLRVDYNGKDGQLALYRETSRDSWRLVWSAERPKDQTPTALLAALTSES
jgi:hypothetical protein